MMCCNDSWLMSMRFGMPEILEISKLPMQSLLSNRCEVCMEILMVQCWGESIRVGSSSSVSKLKWLWRILADIPVVIIRESPICCASIVKYHFYSACSEKQAKCLLSVLRTNILFRLLKLSKPDINFLTVRFFYPVNLLISKKLTASCTTCLFM